MNYIYFLYDPTWGSQYFYVGKAKSLRKRLIKHLLPSELTKNTAKNNWIKKILSKGIRPEIQLVCEVPSYLTWQEAEVQWISFFKWCGIKLLNSTLGGDGYDWTGLHHSEETKDRLSKIMIYRFSIKPFEEETKLKISKSNKGKVRTEVQKAHYRGPKTKEHRLNISLGKDGYEFTEEHKNNISKAKFGKPNKFKNIPRTEEVKQKIRATKAANPHPSPNKGKKLSEGHKKKLSLARKGRKFVPLISYENNGIKFIDGREDKSWKIRPL